MSLPLLFAETVYILECRAHTHSRVERERDQTRWWLEGASGGGDAVWTGKLIIPEEGRL